MTVPHVPPADDAQPKRFDWVAARAPGDADAGAPTLDPVPLPLALPISEIPDAEPVRWATRGLIPAGDLTLLVSDGGVGKTTVALALGGSYTVDAPAFDHADFVSCDGPILYVSEEDSGPVLRNRLQAIARGSGWDVGRVCARFHVLAQHGVFLDLDPWRRHLIAETRRIGAVAVVLDPYTELTVAKENDNTAIKPLIRFFRQLGAETGAAVIVLHHAGKMFEGKRKLDRIRGASALNAAARCILFLEPNDLGIGVEPLKFSRGPLPTRFVIGRDVITEPGNPGSWRTARLTYVTAADAEETAAEQFILAQLERNGSLNSSQLRELAGGRSVEVSAALKRLEVLKKIEYQPGARGAKNWQIAATLSRAGTGSESPRDKEKGQPRNTKSLSHKVGQGGEPPKSDPVPPLGGNRVDRVVTGQVGGSPDGRSRKAHLGTASRETVPAVNGAPDGRPTTPSVRPSIGSSWPRSAT